MKMDDTVALVTGANRGLGLAFVEQLLARGAKRIYVASRDLAKAEQLAAREPRRLVPLRLDITSPTQIAEVAAQATDLTLLINNAGLLGSFNLLDTTPDTLQREFDTNVFGQLAITRALLPALERAQGSAIVNVLTVVSLANMPGIGGYSASKAAALSVTQALRAQLRARGVAVHAAFPGPIDTDMVRALELPKASPESVARAILDGVEAGQEDIAPDAMSQEVLAKWSRAPKEVERQFASM